MTFIDWTDPEDMFDLLVEYVGDEIGEAEDPARQEFLSELLDRLTELQEAVAGQSPLAQSHAMRALRRSLDPEFADDPVVRHVDDCAAELERLGADAAR